LSLRVGITGARGYIGSRLCAGLEAAGHEVVPLVRNAGGNARRFVLGEAVLPEALEDLDVVVHCAWDMQCASADDNRRINIDGSRLLFSAAHRAGISRLVFISTMSAYSECRSAYGQAKLEVEQTARQFGGVSIRPGLVYGAQPGGIVGRLLQLTNSMSVLPMIGRGNYKLHSCHEDDLVELIVITSMCAANKLPAVITAAEEQGRAFTDILTALAGRPLRYIPIPWRLIWLGLRTLEILSLRIGLKSDSLLGLVYSNPEPDFSGLAQLGATFRPLQASDQPGDQQ